MEQTQRPKEQVLTEKTPEPRVEERPVRKLRIETLEGRVAPSAIWGD